MNTALVMPRPGYSRARVVYTAARRIYANRGRYRRALRVTRRAANRYRKRRIFKSRRRRLDGAVRRNLAIKNYVFGTEISEHNLTRKTLVTAPINFADPPDGATGNTRLDQAPGMRFFVKGFKLCAQFRNNETSGALKTISVHYAIIQPKCFSNGTASTTAEIKEEFFSDPSNSTDRYKDFEDFATDPAWNKNQDCLGINTRKYRVFTHSKFLLGPNVAGNTIRPIRTVDKYFKINKSFEFERTASTTISKPLYMCVWYESCVATAVSESKLDIHAATVAYVSPNRTG